MASDRGGGPGGDHRDLIVTLGRPAQAACGYVERSFVAAGGLISYGRITSTSTGARAKSIASSRRKPADSWVQARQV